MTAQRKKFLHLLKLRRGNLRKRIFLRVHDSRLKRRIDLGERHGRWIGSVIFEHFDAPDAARHSQLDSSEILGFNDGPHVVRDVAESVLPNSQDSRSFCRESLKQELLDLLVLTYFFHVSTAHNNVGHLEDAEFFFDRAHDSGGQKHLRRADFDAPHHLLVAAELTGMEDLDFYFSFERGVDSLGVFISRDGEKGAGEAHVAKSQGNGLRRRGLMPETQQAQNENSEESTLHCVLLSGLQRRAIAVRSGRSSCSNRSNRLKAIELFQTIERFDLS